MNWLVCHAYGGISIYAISFFFHRPNAVASHNFSIKTRKKERFPDIVPALIGNVFHKRTVWRTSYKCANVAEIELHFIGIQKAILPLAGIGKITHFDDNSIHSSGTL